MKAEQKLYETDPEFMERFEHFAYEEVVKEEGQTLDEKTRYLAILATLLGCQGLDVFKATLPEALDAGLSSDDQRDCLPGSRLPGDREDVPLPWRGK